MSTLRVGSQDTLTGTCYDVLAKTRSPMDLTGATIIIRALINGAVKQFTATPDADQVINKGKYMYDLQPTDFDTAGRVELKAVITAGSRTYKSKSAYLRVYSVF